MNKRVLFIDRDGTLIIEPPDEQVDTLDELEFYPKVIRNLYNIRKNLDFDLVIVSNQDGLGTSKYPEEKFQLVQKKMLRTFENEEVTFDDIFIDKSFASENKPTRKPGTGMLGKFMSGNYDLANSFVIGDRITDIKLAKNLGSKGILLNDRSMWLALQEEQLEEYCVLITKDWDEIYEFLSLNQRTAEIHRQTNETDINVKINLNGSGYSYISTGIGFFDHMLDQIAKHSSSDLEIRVKGDLHIDEHHMIEDTAITLGEAFYKAIGDKRGIERYGFVLPMDDCLAQVAIDFGGRSWLIWDVEFKREKIGDMPTELFKHFFKSFADSAKCNIYVKAEGENEHHKIESIFKAFAKAIKMAKKRDIFNYDLPSTKGVL
jgi:imidazoleglycerol-phosphate dehydratase/histidinol-phosphatase